MIQTQGQTAHKSFFLLKIQSGQLAVVFLCNGTCLEHIVFQLTLRVCGVQNQECHKEHTLISALQVLKQLLGFCAVGSKVRGNDVHIVSGANSLFLFFDLGTVEISNLSLNRFDCLDLIQRTDMEIDDQGAFHVQKIRKHTVVQFRGEDLDERNSTELLAHTEHLSGTELKGTRCNKILGGQARRSQPVP